MKRSIANKILSGLVFTLVISVATIVGGAFCALGVYLMHRHPIAMPFVVLLGIGMGFGFNDPYKFFKEDAPSKRRRK